MIRERAFGVVDGRKVMLFTISNGAGYEVAITNFGATVTELWAPDRRGERADIVLGYDDLAGYVNGHYYFGCMVGRCANRIAGGRFEIDGRSSTLATNNGPNHLHGGIKGYNKVVWEAEPFAAEDGEGVRLSYNSPDGEEGYPGSVRLMMHYVLTDRNELRLLIDAETSDPTVINIAHHGYWNLAGHDSGTILDHELTLHAGRYTPVDPTFIPTGALPEVVGTPFDFRSPTPIGKRIGSLERVGPMDPGGYDLNYPIDGPAGMLRPASRLRDPKSGRTMEIRTDQPGVQFYSGNYLDGPTGKHGTRYAKHAGLCLETQHFPDAVNRRGQPGWPDPVLRPGQRYRHLMVHAFATD
ncbi:MAG: galactose mutarotase [Phycisphaerales bacterium]|nr:galactose mutarotase [Phycisphaerales bacterium]